MDLQGLKSSLDSLSLRRLLKPKTLEHLVLGTKFLLVLLTLAVVALGAKSVTDTQDLFSTKFESFEKKIDSATLDNQASPKSTKVHDAQSIQLTKLFGPIGASAPATAPQKPSESLLPLSLIGVFLPDNEDPYAIIQDDKKNLQDVFSIDESIFGAAKLLAIFQDRVEIDRNGTKEVLIMDSTTSKGGDSTATGATSEDEFVVAEDELDKALENLPLLLTQARAVPYFKDGKAVGLRLFAIRTGSLFEKIGLQNGDVLKSVNGSSLADLSQAMQLFQKLKEERSIALSLERNMVEKQFKYQIR